MPDQTPAALNFLPWMRQGAAAEITVPDTLGPAQPATVTLQAKLNVNQTEVVMPVRLHGPDTVTGIDPKQVIRTEPKHLTMDFEPNYFPAIEFDQPDFPWLFTPAKPGANERLRPWLCLIVVRKQAGVTLRFNQGAPLPLLEIKEPAKPKDELPNLAESWSWAHAQVSGGSAAAFLTDSLKRSPELTLSRLICTRKLEPLTDYIACVVPAFDVGRKTGLGIKVGEPELAKLDPAWPAPDQAPKLILLPVYYRWEFRTGQGGDFESLVRLLQPRPLPEGVGRRDLYIGDASSRLPKIAQGAPGSTLGLESALMPLDFQPTAWSSEHREPYQLKLESVLNAPAEAQAKGAVDPIVAPPIYGRWHAAKERVEAKPKPPSPLFTLALPRPWLNELNLDPRQRVAAGLGTQVVQNDQEDLMAAAWEQVGEINRANQLLRQAQLARAVSGVFYAKQFSKFSVDTFLQVSGPALGQLRGTLPSGSTSGAMTTFRAEMSRSALPITAVSSTMRRVTRPRGTLARRMSLQRSAPQVRPLVSLLNVFDLTAFKKPGMVTIEDVTEIIFKNNASLNTKVRYYGATEAELTVVNGRNTFEVKKEGEVVPIPPPIRMRLVDNQVAANFRAAAIAHQNRLPRFIGFKIAMIPMKLEIVKDPVLKQLDPETTITARVKSRISNQPAGWSPTDQLDPIMAAPQFPRPMYEALRDISQDFLLPGLEKVPPNTVTLAQTNPRFVEAFLAGLNHEMGRELLWREYPTDQRGTYFRRFWSVLNPAQADQIQVMHLWSRSLGSNGNPNFPNASLVLLIRGELLRRYPTAIIYATRAVTTPEGRRKPSAEEKFPLFRGNLQPDVTFLGFELTKEKACGVVGLNGEVIDPGWFFVIQQQPTEPRFGLDEGESLPSNPTNSAALASTTLQLPVRILIHASSLFPK